MMISGLLITTSSTSQQCTAHAELVFEGLGLQVVVLLMSSNWNVQDVTAN
jgi:hypothetical protein